MGREFSNLGYCTNVHAGADLAQTRANLTRYALEVKRRVSPAGPLGIGLWLSARAAEQLLLERRVAEFGSFLREAGLVPYTFNGFPYGDFHQSIVKHRVYEPTWWDPARLEYTLDLIAIQHGLLPPGQHGSISTLPLAWGVPRPTHEQLTQAAAHLHTVAQHLRRLERETGRFIVLALEPEPGCALQRSSDIIRFFHDYLWKTPDVESVRRYLGVCHDVCHAAVMFEPQEQVFRTFQTAAIRVGKVQVSAAVKTPVLDEIPVEEARAALRQLGEFREVRYLHQTSVRFRADEQPDFFEDLPEALASANLERPAGEWCTHFHVPVYLDRFGNLLATQQEIRECLAAARRYSDVQHFEVETYAWGVLPPELRCDDLAEGIARELTWFADLWDAQAKEDV